jgi:hypothetical protein
MREDARLGFIGVIAGLVLFAWDRRDEQLARAGDVLGADAACEQAVMANAVKACSATIKMRIRIASGLNLIVAAIILWNTRYLAPAFAELGRRGHDVSPELIRHVAPLGWQHIALTGDYTWNLAAPLAPDALRPLRNESSILAA